MGEISFLGDAVAASAAILVGKGGTLGVFREGTCEKR